MPKGFEPTVFVSSTCYDLSQVRVDLKLFIESIGLVPVLSEFNSFPINPDYDTVSNCLDNIKCRADIFVLIVGGRYGYQTKTGKSVTNIEYLEAKAKGIPIYVFIDKTIQNIFSVWEHNKDGDYSKFVDSPKLFEFIASLKESQGNWIYSFETAQNIISTLKNQLAYLFMDALEIRKKFSVQAIEKYSDLPPKALEIVMTKPFGWEYRLFVQLLKDGISSNQNKRYDLDYRVSFGRCIKLDELHELRNWILSKMGEVSNTIQSITRLMNEGLPKAFGELGVAGDSEHIIYIAYKIIEGYCRLMDWSLEFNCIDTKKDFERLILLISKISMNAIIEIEEFSKKIHNEVNIALDNKENIPVGTVIHFTLILSAPDMTELNLELNLLQAKYIG